MRLFSSTLAIMALPVLLSVSAGCDQGSKPSDRPAAPGATSSERGETHPQQPTGEPQSGEVTQPAGTR